METLLPNEINYAELESKIGYIFIKKEKLTRALTRPALANELLVKKIIRESQETLCTLGDGILRGILVERLMPNFSKKGEITKEKIRLEQNEKLPLLSKDWNLHKFIETNESEKKDQRSKETQITDTVEAIIGAIYLDGGYEITKRVVNKWYSGLASEKLDLSFNK